MKLFLSFTVAALMQSVVWAEGAFEGWALNSGRGEDSGEALMVEGDGKSDNAWLSPPMTFEVGGAYRLRFRARSEGAGGGTVVCGIPSVNVDIGVPGAEWTEYSHVFAVPGAAGDAVKEPLRLGQWTMAGKAFFKDVSVAPMTPVYARRGDVALGEGERIDGKVYTFNAPFGTECRNHSRPLAAATATYNSTRWCLGDGTSFTYRHEVGGRRLLSARVGVTVGYHRAGRAVVEVSGDGAAWQEVGAVDKVGAVSAEVPAALFPAGSVLVRVRGEGRPCTLQVYGYTFSAEVDGAPLSLVGSTQYLEILKRPEREGMKVEVVEVADLIPDGTPKKAVLRVTLAEGMRLAASMLTKGRSASSVSSKSTVQQYRPGTHTVEIPYEDAPRCGEYDVTVTLVDLEAANKEKVFEARVRMSVPAFYDASYGMLLPCADEGVALWRASSGWKVPRHRALPGAKMEAPEMKLAQADALEMRLAQNEWEATQLVVSPKRDLANVRVRVEGLDGLRAEVLRVGYVPVAQRTDATGVLADWPDPLLPQETIRNEELGIRNQENQPFWIRVFAPKGVRAGARAGLHVGRVVVEADGVLEEVALKVFVYGFALPDVMTCETAFGFDPRMVWRYHNVKDEAQRREVLDKYLRALADHRISPYNPAPMDGWSVTWTGLPPWDGGTVEDGALVVRDASETACVSASHKGNFAIPAKGLKVAFKYRTEQTPDTLFTLRHFDGGGAWMSGRNNDTRLPAAAEWTAHETTVTRFPEGAAAVNLTFWGAGWQEPGRQVGTTFVKDVSVIDLSTGRELIAPGALAPFDASKAQPVFDWARWDAAMEHALTNYHFNTFQIGLAGLGGGTFHSRSEPTFMGYAEDTPEYHALFGKYAAGIEAHLREKGWLDKAFVYWFDEPAEKDYAFVMNGFSKLKKYAPGLRRMLTEKVAEGLVGGPNVWCPLTPSLNVPLSAGRRDAGDAFWWYVCCGPKAPYVTEFIDHPGTEMRLWLWQTWQERVSGILIWETVYWTSSAAYPDPAAPQNPYLDPMCWESGYDAGPGTKQPWGNGDGRFLYPPLAAADGRPAAPVLAAPVDSIRLEMLRDGIEDYEYFVILKRLLAEKKPTLPAARHAEYEALLTVPEEVSASLTSFTRDPAPMELHRHRLAQAIEELLGRNEK
ncbi:MAG: DUF4091 domain-containing protein [Kiritimatiellaeota bacterium]|nr:DUF4091 domain-containing protein [Kiritimatiellota bacterium]